MAGKAGLFSKLKPKAFPGAGAAAAKKLAAAKGMKEPPKAPDHEAHRDHEGTMDENAAYHADRAKDMHSMALTAESNGEGEKAKGLRKAGEHHEAAMKAHDKYLEHVRKADLNNPGDRKTADELHTEAGEAAKTAEREEAAHFTKHSTPSQGSESKPVPKPPEKTEADLRNEATEASKKGQFNLRDKLDEQADKARKMPEKKDTSRNLETGKRGGRYYVNSAGAKVYVR